MTVEINATAYGQDRDTLASVNLGTELARHYLARRPSPAGWQDRLKDLESAYLSQAAMVDAFAAAGQGALAGYKVGMTARSMQQLVGIETPIGGQMLSANMMKSGAELCRADYLHVGIESELAFIMSRDVAGPLSTDDDDVCDHIATAHASFEVVDDRHADYSQLSAPLLVAENIWNVGAVLGEGVPPADLGPIDRLAGRYSENGVEIAAGMTSDVLGNPLNVIRWLSNFLLQRGSMLRKGQVVLTGSITAIRFPQAGTDCRFEIDNLPPVDVRFV